jgi:hypothetical protein
MSSLDSQWRELLSRINQKRLCENMQFQFESIVKFAASLKLVSVTPGMSAGLAESTHDIGTFVGKMSRVPLSIPAGGTIAFSRVCFLISTGRYSGMDSGGDSPSKVEPIIRTLARELVPLAECLRLHRNIMSHNSEVADVGGTLQLCGTIARLIEISLDCNPIELLELYKLAVKTANMCTSSSQDGPDQDRQNEAGAKVGGKNESLGLKPDVMLSRTMKQGFEAIEGQISDLREQMTAIEIRKIQFANEAEYESFGANSEEDDTDEKEQGYLHSLLNWDLLAKLSEDERERYLADMLSRINPAFLSKYQDGSQNDKFSGEETETLLDAIESDSLVLIGVTLELLQMTQKASKGQEGITLLQAEGRLRALRDEIKADYHNHGIRLDNWDYVVQGPIVKEMLLAKPKTIDEWRELPAFVSKYNELNKECMDEQLREHGEEALEIIRLIVV